MVSTHYLKSDLKTTPNAKETLICLYPHVDAFALLNNFNLLLSFHLQFSRDLKEFQILSFVNAFMQIQWD